MQKRGYFFSIDAFIAMIIIVAGIVLILAQFTTKPYQMQTFLISEDFLNTLANTKIYEINDYDYSEIKDQKTNGHITSLSNSILEQMGEYYYRNLTLNNMGCTSEACSNPLNSDCSCINKSTEFLESFLHNSIPSQYDLFISMETKKIFYNSTDPTLSRNLIVYKRIVSGVYNNTYSWGPYVVNITVWQRIQ